MDDLYEALEPYVAARTSTEDDRWKTRKTSRQQAAAARHHRPAQCRQVDAGQCASGRRARADRPRGRHHARCHCHPIGRGAAKPIKLWDTAGIRRKSRVTGKVEKLAVADALARYPFRRCVVVLIDASLEIERQDLTLADLVAQEGRAVVIALSKWDMVEDKQKRLKHDERTISRISCRKSAACRWSPLSAQQEQGLDKLMKAVFAAAEKWNSRISTGQLNRWLETMLERNPPPAPVGPAHQDQICDAGRMRGRRPSRCSAISSINLPESYVRYLMNGLRKDFDLWGVPIRFSLRGGKNPYDSDRQ